MLAEASSGGQGEPCAKELLFTKGSRTKQLLISYSPLKKITSEENQGGRERGE